MSNRGLMGVVVALVAGTCGSVQAFTPPTDAEIDAIIATYQEKQKAAGQDGEARKAAAMAAAESLDKLSFAEMSLKQIRTLQKSRILMTAPAKRSAVFERLGELAKDNGASGAEAALARIEFVPPPVMTNPNDDSGYKAYGRARVKELENAAKHPGFAEAAKGPTGESFLATVASLDGEDLAGSPVWDAVERAIPAEMTIPGAMAAGSVIGVAADPDAKLPREKLEAIRTKILAGVTAARAKLGTDEKDQFIAKRLDGAITELNGAFAKGQLVGHKAPALTLEWASTGEGLKSLDDLKGKVVVLDFWATWCGPCVASFPRVRELKARYEGYPVEILGVTSIQGSHYKRSLDKAVKPERIDTKGDPAKEMALMKDFMKDMDMTWDVAFSKENVFNPEYGIHGIPHVVILDPNGVVRHRGLHPAVDPEKKHQMIDAILKEFHLPAPAAEATPKEEKPEKKGG